MAGPDLDEDHLAALMKVFANPVRVELVKVLTRPHALGEIRLGPRRHEGRVMSRQAVTEHLQCLVAVGVVRSWEVERGGRLVQVHQVNHSQLFALTENLRELGRIHPDGPAMLDGTMPGPPRPVPQQATGPSLTAVSGPREGARFPLVGEGPWRIGRAARLAVCLDYDPFLSTENTEVAKGPVGFTIRSLPKSRNGTTLNWRLLPSDEPFALASGDVVGVGRTHLVWRA